MNLENLNLVELNARELQETEGGWVWGAMKAAAVIIAVGAAIDWTIGEIQEGWNNPQ